jgi:YfiH family protein
MAEYLTSELLRGAGFRHAFFTRNGGVSSGPYRSLNFSIAVGDDPAFVDVNFERAAEVLAVPAPRLYFLSQVHGSASVIADGAEPRAEFVRREGDIVSSSTANLAAAVRTADCVPILLADRESGAVAAVHAGWRGVARGAVEAGVEALRALAGNRGELLAAIGPHISREAFEVSEDVAIELERASPERDVVDRNRARPHVDLGRIVHAKLRAAGLAHEAIDQVFGCTFLDEARFFSFRRDGSASGRHLSAIVAKTG